MSINNHGSDQEEYTLDEEIDQNQNQQWREEFNVAKIFHIVEISIHQTTLEDHPTNKLKFDHYVDMPRSPTVI
jgi:hypothetical protein